MKIAINGNVINTKKIYNITKIEGDFDLNTSHYLKDSKIKDKHATLWFKILFLNGERLVIKITGDDLFERKVNYHWNDWFTKDYDNKIIKLEEKITTLRNSIIEIWSKNKSQIPQFNL